jgi:hypothetical protein
MWIITYTKDWHYRDRDNYSQTSIGEAETAEGDTLKEAINHLIKMEASPGMIENYATSSYDGYSSIDIINIHKISKRINLEFENIPAIKKMIEEKKEKLIKEKEDEKKKEKRNKKARERAELKRLKEKYEK